MCSRRKVNIPLIDLEELDNCLHKFDHSNDEERQDKRSKDEILSRQGTEDSKGDEKESGIGHPSFRPQRTKVWSGYVHRQRGTDCWCE